MDVINSKKFYSGSQKLKLGRFIRKSEKPTFQPFFINEQRKTKNDLVHVFTLEGVEDIFQFQLKMIREAKSSIKLVSFVFDDGPLVKEIVKLLIEKVRQGVKVKVFTTLKPNDFKVASIAESEEVNFNHHIKVVKELARHGIRLRARSDCHGKFCVTDRKYALISSANLTDFSYNRNPEFGCFYQNKIEVLKLDCIFDHLWKEAYEFFVSNNSGEFFVEERKPAIKNYKELFPFTKGNLDYEILYTYVENTKFGDTVAALFQQARKEIIISTYLVRSLENTCVGIELLRALDRSVKVSIITRPANRRTDHLEGCHQLFQKGAQIYGNIYNHAKIFSVDGQKCAVFTGNLDGVHGIENGIEFGILLKNRDFITFPMDYNQYLLEQSEFIFADEVTQADLCKAQNQPCVLGNLTLMIPKIINTGRTTIDGQTIYDSIGTDEIRVAHNKEKHELKMITPEFALVFQEEEPSSFHLLKVFHSKHSAYQNISKELSRYLVDTIVHVKLTS